MPVTYHQDSSHQELHQSDKEAVLFRLRDRSCYGLALNALSRAMRLCNKKPGAVDSVDLHQAQPESGALTFNADGFPPLSIGRGKNPISSNISQRARAHFLGTVMPLADCVCSKLLRFGELLCKTGCLGPALTPRQ